jgi:hypothetical protein
MTSCSRIRRRPRDRGGVLAARERDAHDHQNRAPVDRGPGLHVDDRVAVGEHKEGAVTPIVVQYGTYQCAECFQPLLPQYGHPMHGNGTYILVCRNPACERNGLKLKIQAKTIEVEELHDA